MCCISFPKGNKPKSFFAKQVFFIGLTMSPLISVEFYHTLMSEDEFPVFNLKMTGLWSLSGILYETCESNLGKIKILKL